MDSATNRIATYLTTAYHKMNDALFGGELPDAVLTIHRHRSAYGYFAPNRFGDRGDEDMVLDEIALNPDTFSRRTDREIVSTLLHEMCHLWQQHFDTPSRNGYHNKRWAAKMLEVGLVPRSLDNPGKMTGQKVTHDIDEGGAFDVLWERLELDGDLFDDLWAKSKPEMEVGKKRTRSANKTKYACPLCDAVAWGKPNLYIMCGDCEERMEAQ